MNKQAIWLIIGLMSAALIGVAGMQVKWIVESFQANEEQFNNRVVGALNGVAEKLEAQENMDFLRNVDNGFAQDYIQNEMQERMKEGEMNLPKAPQEETPEEHAEEGHVHLTKQQLLELTISADTCQCSNCRADREQVFTRWVSYQKGLDLAPIVERVDLEKLGAFLSMELKDKGIKLPFSYGIFDSRKSSFVIADGHYVVEDSRSQPMQKDYKNLNASEYRVNLFQQDVEPPGMLMVFFPTKASFIWGSVMKTLLASILFTGIILFCFAYTISVIFKQKKLSEMKNDFINNMTHEFKTPIATISLASDSITSPMVVTQPDKIRRFIDIIRQENKRMNNQVEKVLQMAQIDRQEYSLKLGEVNLNEVIAQAVDNIHLQVERKEGTTATDLKAAKPTVQGDATHIASVVNNLLDNANKYSPEKPEISVSTRNVNGGVEVIVSDKGIGMTKEAKKHIFERFFRVHTGNLHDVKGFGLGLSYVKAMMIAHKGTVDVKSELGKGSSFILYFPFKVEN